MATFHPLLNEEDETVVEYICDLLINSQEDDATLVEVMQTHFYPLEDQPTVSIMSKLNDFQYKVRNPHAAPPASNEQPALFPSSLSQNDENDEEEDDAAATREQREFLNTLSEVCGVTNEDDTLMFLCKKIVLSSDVEECARWVLDHGWDSLKQKKAAYDATQSKLEAKQSKHEQLARNRVLKRFDEQECDSAAARARQMTKSRAVSASTSNESKIRFLDNKVVSMRGEKYIEVQTKEDWDGGSRGRIKTKGKRGPGHKPG